MNRVSRRDMRLQVLVDRHRSLDREADTLSSLRYLTPDEEKRLKELKMMRLRAKRAIDFFKNTDSTD